MAIRLTFLSPQERENLARWIERKVANYPEAIRKAKATMARGINVDGLRKQISYWESCIAHNKKLAWEVRTEKGARLPEPETPPTD